MNAAKLEGPLLELAGRVGARLDDFLSTCAPNGYLIPWKFMVCVSVCLSVRIWICLYLCLLLCGCLQAFACSFRSVVAFKTGDSESCLNWSHRVAAAYRAAPPDVVLETPLIALGVRTVEVLRGTGPLPDCDYIESLLAKHKGIWPLATHMIVHYPVSGHVEEGTDRMSPCRWAEEVSAFASRGEDHSSTDARSSSSTVLDSSAPPSG
jgi:hypothetical protein